MKKLCYSVSVVILLMATLLNSITFAEKSWIEYDYDLSGFTNLLAEEAFTVNLTQGDEFSVKVRVTKEIKDKLDVRVDGNTLILGVKSGKSIINTDFVADVTMPDLNTLKVKSAATVKGEMNVESLSIEASSAATVVLKGSSDKLEIQSLHASSVFMDEFVAKDCEVICKHASDVDIQVSESIEAMARTASDISITGDGEVTASSDITSDIKVGGQVLPEEDEITTGDMFINDYQVTATVDGLNNFWTRHMLKWEDNIEMSAEEFEEAMKEFESSMEDLGDVLEEFGDNLSDWFSNWN